MSQLWLIVIPALITAFSSHPTLSSDTVYIGGSGKIGVQIDLGALDIGTHPNPVHSTFEFTNSLNDFEKFEPIQLKAPNIDQNSKNQSGSFEADSSKINQELETKKALTIHAKKPKQRPKIPTGTNNITPDIPDKVLNSEQKNLASYNASERPNSADKTPEQEPEIELKTGSSWIISFIPEEAQLPNSSLGTLKSIAISLNQNEIFRLQLKAYAADQGGSASHARRLSLTRALAVRSFLIENGVRSTRIDVRALGNKSKTGKSDRVDVLLVKR